MFSAPANGRRLRRRIARFLDDLPDVALAHHRRVLHGLLAGFDRNLDVADARQMLERGHHCAQAVVEMLSGKF